MTPVKNRTPITYYSISREGKIRHKDSRTGVEKIYDTIEGYLVSIQLKEKEYEGEKRTVWYFTFEDKEHDQMDILQVGEASSAAHGILTSLASHPGNLGWVSISPKLSKPDDKGKQYTNVWVEIDGKTTDWLPAIKNNIPELEEVRLPSGKKILDNSKRLDFYRGVAAKVKKEKLNLREEEYDKQKQERKKKPLNPTDDNRRSGASNKQPKHQPEPPPPEDEDLGGKDLNSIDNWDDIDDDLPF